VRTLRSRAETRIAEAFHVSVTLDDLYFGVGLECAPGSIQPVIYMKDGERQIGEMRWGFKLPDRLLSMRGLTV